MQSLLSYKIAMGLFVFGFVCSALVSAGITGEGTLPTQTATVDEDYYQAVGDEVSEHGAIDVFAIPWLLITTAGALLQALVAVFTVLPMLMRFGMPAEFAMMIQAPIWIVYVKDVYTIYTGN